MKQICSIVAYDESGAAVTICAYRKVIETTTMRSSVREEALGGRIWLTTSDGRPVNRIDRRTFEIAESRQIVRTETDPEF